MPRFRPHLVTISVTALAAVLLIINSFTHPGGTARASWRPAAGMRVMSIRQVDPVESTPDTSPSHRPLRYHGGPVMTGPVRVYVIWYGAWARKVRRRTIITDFLGNLAGARFAINQTYPDASGSTVANSITLAGQVFDRGSVGKRGVTDESIGTVVAAALDANRLPADPHGIYLVLTSTEVDKLGFLTRYCGWHSFARYGSATIKFALVGDPTGANLRRCAPQSVGPNGDAGADAMVNVIAHEIDESVTDPEFTGWSDGSGEENADRCSWFYGSTYPVRRARANVRLGRRHFYLQANWVNRPVGSCALGPDPFPTRHA